MSWRILGGDSSDLLRGLDAGSVQTCITSPPYWGLRDYGADGQLGLEPTPEQYVENMVAVFREVRRVLRDDGTLWLNLGGSYANTGLKEQGDKAFRSSGLRSGNISRAEPSAATRSSQPIKQIPPGLKPKDLVGIPWRVAFALQADDWWLRSDIIWAKPNPMPESVTDRPTRAHEYIFLLTKSARYWYDSDAVREEGKDWNRGMRDRSGGLYDGTPYPDGTPPQNGLRDATMTGHNKRSVWTVTTQPYAEAHFATFPPKLVEPCILAGSPPKCCGECGAPWERVTKNHGPDKPNPHERHVPGGQERQRGLSGVQMGARWQIETLGWRSTCDHDDDSGTATVLDPFAGAGTTGLVALRHNRSFVGIELNPDYAEMARNRIRDDAPLLNVGAEAA